jgi:hypothetical protein
VYCSWWDIPVNVFETLEEESHSMHHLQAVQIAGAKDLNNKQICTMAKQITDKLHLHR